ncbi:GIY-YIG nuclease family protein [Chelatococcus sambhunathii]|uniref:GIY-YIG nuclease family protein n=1 Tax=Chelatococcus sambhunathii TaxID=363953 RepID=A0ABU1DI16_9HYPH|nr:GIY-YIG nuclease family protein [Chelatococcus sambhunathii]MDR4307757.1 GIY-YIG nuclease family protein [Chelatococcus sambhunathii]
MERSFYVYILASQRNGTLYVGMTSDLVRRVWEHREGAVGGFTKAYRVHHLVWFERHATAESAIRREKRLKTWLRAWKIDLIEMTNPQWDDLYEQIARP